MATQYPDRINILGQARRRGSAGEDGYILVAVMFMVAILAISLAVAAPRIKQQLQRDRELEATHRGKQYIRAIQLYYRKFNKYPPNVEALENTNELRFLRKRYVDPITGKDDWHPILFGQNKVPTVMGFFGQALPGSSIAGTGPGGAGPVSAGNGGIAISNEDAPAANAAPASPATNSSAASNQAPADGSATLDSAGGPTLGGAGIIGFSIPSEKQSILVYKKQTHFNLWEFVFDPMQQMAYSAGAAAGGNSGALGSPTGSQPTQGFPGSGAPTNSPWGPNGNLPGAGPGNNGQWGPNGNLPTPPQPQQ